jgi:hypothetical protein
MAFGSLAKLHEKAIHGLKRARSMLDTHKESMSTIVSEAVRTGESLAGGATAAGIDYYLATDKTAALPEAVVGGVPVVPVAALLAKGAAFAFMGQRFASDLHAYSNGLGAAATYAGLMRMFKAQATGQ